MRDFLQRSGWFDFGQPKATVRQAKPQQNTVWHWLILLSFGLFITGGPLLKVSLLVVFTLITAGIKGPITTGLGLIYAALVAFFPPLAFVISLVALCLNLQSFKQNKALIGVSIYYYALPFVLLLVEKGLDWSAGSWQVTGLLVVSVVGLHGLLLWLYQQRYQSLSVLWSVISLPYTIGFIFLPKKIRGYQRSYQQRFRTKP